MCDDDVAKERLERDLAVGAHPARNRTFELYLAGKARAEALTIPKLTLETGLLTIEECTARARAYLDS